MQLYCVLDWYWVVYWLIVSVPRVSIQEIQFCAYHVLIFSNFNMLTSYDMHFVRFYTYILWSNNKQMPKYDKRFS